MSNKLAHTRVKVIKGNIQLALKKWKNKTFDSGHLNELKDRREFLKPSVVKRKQKKDAIRAQKWSDEKESI